MEAELPRLDTLMLKHSDDDDMYRGVSTNLTPRVSAFLSGDPVGIAEYTDGQHELERSTS